MHTNLCVLIEISMEIGMLNFCDVINCIFVHSPKQITLAPSEIPANLPGQFSLSGQIFLQWAAATLKGLVGFQNKKF